MSASEKLPQFSQPYWRDLDFPSFKPLTEDLTVHVAIVGAGITGITAAYLLSKAGVKVALLEANKVLDGTTGHTTAKLTAQHNLIYDELVSHFGEEKARLYYQSHQDAINFVKQKVNEKGIDCDFSQENATVYAYTAEYAAKLQTEMEAYRRLGIAGALKDTIPFPIEITGALMMENQAQYHPLKFLKSLLQEAVDSGCQVYEETTATDIEDDKTAPKVYLKGGYKVTCNHVIMASHFPFYDKIGLFYARMYADRSYAIGITTEEEYPGGMYVSADYPARSIRSTPFNGDKLLIIGGETHKTGQGTNMMKHYEAIAEFAMTTFRVKEILYRWSAQDLVTLDKLPYIGPMTEGRERVLIATGYKKWGMTTGIMAGHLLADYVLAQDSPYKELYTPSRFQADPDVKKAITTNFDVAKHLLKGKLEVVDKVTDELHDGEGSVVMYEGKRAGAYKDENGKLFVVDTTCTHMGCECEWNAAEKTWDCPCHGSRYSFTGEVIEGPALKDLTVLTDEEN
ncbi:FAD-dependent oxidoreductase [Bacillus rubiinfantis]|uniref:FAD-dependent oxidoreductase n=1 Tax=Bacillus rubiinfantis TaxID=1499680 RepID=UPI0005A932B3|nr:FAD-dependent oxidoreductase [Bacillus rubiinfantis]